MNKEKIAKRIEKYNENIGKKHEQLEKDLNKDLKEDFSSLSKDIVMRNWLTREYDQLYVIDVLREDLKQNLSDESSKKDALKRLDNIKNDIEKNNVKE